MPRNPMIDWDGKTLDQYFADFEDPANNARTCSFYLSNNAKNLTFGDMMRLNGWSKGQEAPPGGQPQLKGLTIQDLNSIGDAFENAMKSNDAKGKGKGPVDGGQWKYRRDVTFTCCACGGCCAVVVPPDRHTL